MMHFKTLVVVIVLLATAACHGSDSKTSAVDTTLPDEKVATNPTTAAAAPGNDILGAMAASGSVTPIASFGRPKLPTDVEQTQCHMGECTWEQIVAVADISTKDGDVLRRVLSRFTTTDTPDGDYPKELPPGPHDWKQTTSYFICSLQRPTALSPSLDGNGFSVTPLHVVSPFGYETSSVANYKRACHGIAVGSEADQHPESIGYADRQDGPDQSSVKQPMDAF